MGEKKHLLVFDFDGVLAISWSSPPTLFDQVGKLLHRLHANGHIIVLASFNPTAEECLIKHGVRHLFSAIRAGSDEPWIPPYSSEFSRTLVFQSIPIGGQATTISNFDDHQQKHHVVADDVDEEAEKNIIIEKNVTKQKDPCENNVVVHGTTKPMSKSGQIESMLKKELASTDLSIKNVLFFDDCLENVVDVAKVVGLERSILIDTGLGLTEAVLNRCLLVF